VQEWNRKLATGVWTIADLIPTDEQLAADPELQNWFAGVGPPPASSWRPEPPPKLSGARRIISRPRILRRSRARAGRQRSAAVSAPGHPGRRPTDHDRDQLI